MFHSRVSLYKVLWAILLARGTPGHPESDTLRGFFPRVALIA
jgi:hypothetical protein